MKGRPSLLSNILLENLCYPNGEFMLPTPLHPVTIFPSSTSSTQSWTHIHLVRTHGRDTEPYVSYTDSPCNYIKDVGGHKLKGSRSSIVTKFVTVMAVSMKRHLREGLTQDKIGSFSHFFFIFFFSVLNHANLQRNFF